MLALVCSIFLNSLISKMNTQSAFTTNTFIRWSIGAMAPRMKRLVYLSSLAAVINNTQTLDKDITVKLNEILHLSNTGTSALKLPIQLSNVLWSNKKILKEHFAKLKESKTSSICALDSIRKILSTSPSWIRYGSESEMMEDISSLFCSENNLIKSA